MVDHILKASQEQNKMISIMYQKGNEITQRNIRVLSVEGDNVKAMCYLRHEPRMFRKKDILAAEYCRKH